MSIWIRALCTKAVGDVTPAELRAGIAERLPVLASLYGEDDAEATVGRLRIEGEAPIGAWKLSYEAGDRSIGAERWSEPGRVRKEISALRASLEDCEEDEVDDVRALLDDVVEIVGFEVSLKDCESIGWPIAIAAAACVAARGEGLIQADGEGWMAPQGREVEHVLDGD